MMKNREESRKKNLIWKKQSRKKNHESFDTILNFCYWMIDEEQKQTDARNCTKERKMREEESSVFFINQK